MVHKILTNLSLTFLALPGAQGMLMFIGLSGALNHCISGSDLQAFSQIQV